MNNQINITVDSTDLNIVNAPLTITGNGVVAGSNTQVQYNNAGVFGASANFVYNEVSSNLSVSGNVITNNLVSNTALVGNTITISNGSGGAITGANSISANYFTGNGSLLSSITAANIVGVVANANYAAFAGNATVANTVVDNAQPNITSVGNLTSLTVDGISTLGNISNVKIQGGNAGQGIITDGLGNLAFSNIGSGGIVPVYANTDDRDTDIPVPVPGQLCLVSNAYNANYEIVPLYMGYNGFNWQIIESADESNPNITNAMRLIINTGLLPNNTVSLNLAGNVNVTVHWDDNTSNLYTTNTTATHTYTGAGYYQVQLVGNLDNFVVANGANSFITCASFGELDLKTFSFPNCLNLTNVSNILPNTVTSLANAFRFCRKLNDSNITQWNVSNVSNMASMLVSANAFNQPIGNWNVSNVTDMTSVFANANTFNQSIGNWNVSNVTTMASMFSGASAFNQDIGNWNVSNVTIMGGLMSSASAFNQDIGNWNVSNVTNMISMFAGGSFNQPIGNWNTSKVSNMALMFNNTSAFNQDIGNWNVSNVTSTWGMFANASAFNQDISNWETGNNSNMTQMFSTAVSFNRDLSSWCVTLIPTKPSLFDTGATSWTGGNATRPQWGTCP